MNQKTPITIKPKPREGGPGIGSDRKRRSADGARRGYQAWYQGEIAARRMSVTVSGSVSGSGSGDARVERPKKAQKNISVHADGSGGTSGGLQVTQAPDQHKPPTAYPLSRAYSTARVGVGYRVASSCTLMAGENGPKIMSKLLRPHARSNQQHRSSMAWAPRRVDHTARVGWHGTEKQERETREKRFELMSTLLLQSYGGGQPDPVGVLSHLEHPAGEVSALVLPLLLELLSTRTSKRRGHERI